MSQLPVLIQCMQSCLEEKKDVEYHQHESYGNDLIRVDDNFPLLTHIFQEFLSLSPFR